MTAVAGISIRLAQLAREGGVAGIAGAAAYGAIISSGPWMITASAMTLLQAWSVERLTPNDNQMLQTVLIYGFSVSAVVAAPIVTVTTRAVSDCLFAKDRESIPGVLMASLLTASSIAIPSGAALFGLVGGLPPLDQVLAISILTLLTQVWVANLFLTAVHRHSAILAAYPLGIIVASAVSSLLFDGQARTLMVAVATGLVTINVALLSAIRQEFGGSIEWPERWSALFRSYWTLAAAGFASTLAVWIDKWMLWFGPDGQTVIGRMRLNPVYDQASFLGLLSLIPGLTLLLIMVETRFEGVFLKLMAACCGSSTYTRIEACRVAVSQSLLHNARLLLVLQGTMACLLWVFAPTLLTALGADMRGVFAFRLTVVGCVFHLLAIFATVALAYYDLFGRVLMVWAAFLAASVTCTLASFDGGFVRYGWGYLAGATVAASTSLVLVAQATRDLNFLLFVANNPAVVGSNRRWA